MNIGFDLDKVFIDYPPFIPPKVVDKLYKKKDNGVLLYRIPSYPEQVFRRFTHLPVLRPAIKENLTFLHSIPKDRNKLYLISSRYKFLEGITQKLIKRYNLDKIFDAMYFNFQNEQPHIFKDTIIKNLHLDLYIDDDLSLLKYVAKRNKKTKFFWLNDSQTGGNLTRNIFPISQLSDILQ